MVWTIASLANFRYPVAMAIKEPSNVTSIKQAERRRVSARRQSFMRRVLPYLIILTIAGIGGVFSLRSMPIGIGKPAANSERLP